MKDWNDLFTYSNGKIYWKNSPAKHITASTEAGCYDPASGYVLVKVQGILTRAHRIIWEMHNGPLGKYIIDHADRNKQNNHLNNLVKCTQLQNQKNRCKQKNNTSGYTGVSWDKARNAWSSKIQVAGKTINLGRFTELEDAIAARELAEVTHNFNPNHGK